MPDVEGGFQPPGENVNGQETLEFSKPLGLREVFSAGLEATALRQAKMPAATTAVAKIHFDGAHFRRDIAAKAF